MTAAKRASTARCDALQSAWNQERQRCNSDVEKQTFQRDAEQSDVRYECGDSKHRQSNEKERTICDVSFATCASDAFHDSSAAACTSTARRHHHDSHSDSAHLAPSQSHRLQSKLLRGVLSRRQRLISLLLRNHDSATTTSAINTHLGGNNDARSVRSRQGTASRTS
jgi:hypothetical protein